MKRLLGYFKYYKWHMIVGPFFKMLEALLELLNPIMVAKIIDHGVSAGDYQYILKYGLLILIFNVVGFGFSIICQKCASLASVGIATRIRHDLFEKVATYSHAELDKFGTASLVNRLTNDINQIENAISVFIRMMIRVPFLLIGAFVLCLIINVKMSIIFLVLIPAMILVLWFYMRKTSPQFHKIRVKLDNIGRITKENLSGTRVIRSFNKQEDEQERFEESTASYTRTNMRVARWTSLLNPFITIIVDWATVAVLYFGGIQINIGSLTQGDVIALIDYVGIITISLLLLSQIIAVFVRTIASVNRVDEALGTDSIIQDPTDIITHRKTEPETLMEFNNVCFNYALDNKERSFIKDLTFSIMPKQTIGIIGGTGSGKSTIANLMTRFYDVNSGEILYRGKNLKDYTVDELRSYISIVQQRSVLFSGSLRENMQIRKKSATDDEIIEALKVSQAWPFVSEWANGLDHQIMAGGKNVSGGQMQRLTIARALVGVPEMLILDDSSSALDFLTDSNLRKAIKKMDCATVIISQRATSIMKADLIIVMDNGDVVGMGKHNQLMENCEI